MSASDEQSVDLAKTSEDHFLRDRTNVSTVAVKLDTLELLERKQDTVEKLHNVKLEKELLLASDQQKPPDVQWFCILGSKDSRRRAAAYIAALCNPVLWTVFEFDSSLQDVVTDEVCRQIEQETEAVLLSDEPGRLVIQGSNQLHIVLALSILESVVAPKSARQSDERVALQAAANSVDLSDSMQVVQSGRHRVGSSSQNEVVEDQLNMDTDFVEIGGLDESVTFVGCVPSFVTSESDVDSLTKLAVSKGYSEQEAKAVLDQKLDQNSEWKESAFLRALHTYRNICTSQHFIASESDSLVKKNCQESMLQPDDKLKLGISGAKGTGSKHDAVILSSDDDSDEVICLKEDDDKSSQSSAEGDNEVMFSKTNATECPSSRFTTSAVVGVTGKTNISSIENKVTHMDVDKGIMSRKAKKKKVPTATLS